MAYYSTATFHLTSSAQIKAARKYQHRSVLIPEQKLEDIMTVDEGGLRLV